MKKRFVTKFHNGLDDFFEVPSRSMYKNICYNFYCEYKKTLKMNLIVPETEVRRCFLKIGILKNFANSTGKKIC